MKLKLARFIVCTISFLLVVSMFSAISPRVEAALGDPYIDMGTTDTADYQYDFDSTIALYVDVDCVPGPKTIDVFTHLQTPNDDTIDGDNYYGWTVQGTVNDGKWFYMDLGFEYMQYVGTQWHIEILVRDSSTFKLYDQKKVFVTIGPVLNEHFTCKDFSNPDGTRTTTFYDTDIMACEYSRWDSHNLWITWSVKYRFYGPMGEYWTSDWYDIPPGYYSTPTYAYIWIKDHVAAQNPGSWHVDVLLEDLFRARDGFDIMATVIPSLDVSLINPPDGSIMETSPVELEARVTSGGSAVQNALVRFYVGGSEVGSDNSDSSGYASINYSPSPGTHSWYATVEKSGYTGDTSPTWTFTYSPPVPDFSISNPGTVTIPEADEKSVTITVTQINGYSGIVSLSATGQPTGIILDFDPTSDTPTFTSTMSIRVGHDVPIDTYQITIIGEGDDGTTHSETFSLAVTSNSGSTSVTCYVPKQPLNSFILGTIDLNSAVVSDSADYELIEGVLTFRDPYRIPLAVTLSAFGHEYTFDIGEVTFTNIMEGWGSSGGESAYILTEGPPFVRPVTSSPGDLLWRVGIGIDYKFDELPPGSESVTVTLDLTKTLEELGPDLLKSFYFEQVIRHWTDLTTISALLLSGAAPLIIQDLIPVIQISTSHFVMSGLFFTALSALIAAITIGIIAGTCMIMASPATILVTDPSGRMTGVTSQGEILSQIEGSVYSVNQTLDAQLIWITNAISGKYRMAINGTDIGDYHLGVFFANGTYSFYQEFVGTTAPSLVDHYVEDVQVGAEPEAIAYEAEPPVASFAESAETVPAGNPIVFDPSGSHDPDGIIVLYEFDFDGDGTYDYSSSTADPVSYTYMTPGTYTVTLRVTDNDGLTDTATATKTITPIPVIPEVPLGTVVATLSMIIALITYLAVPRWRRERKYANL